MSFKNYQRMAILVSYIPSLFTPNCRILRQIPDNVISSVDILVRISKRCELFFYFSALINIFVVENF